MSVLSPAGLFEKDSAIVEFRTNRLPLLAESGFPLSALTDDLLRSKIVAAETELERRLRCFLCPTTVIPQGSTSPPDTRWIEEPGYDYGPELFDGNSWGMIMLRQRPIISIDSIVFAYPDLTSTLYTIPYSWIRIDKQTGLINLVPTQASMAMPLNTFLLSVLGGGRTVPLLLQIRYVCGLQNVAVEYPDVIDLIGKLAILSILQDAFMPASGSISADGLSQSMSFDFTKQQDAVLQRIETLRQAIHGIRSIVC